MKPWAQNLSIDIKTSFETRVLRMVLGSFVDINIFVMKYYFIQFLHILHFCWIKKGNSEVWFNDILLNFWLK